MSSNFDKPALNLEQQVDLLLSSGLIIEDREKAKYYLRFIGYYRLSGYALPFQNGTTSRRFKPYTKFDNVLDLYVFDRKLRLLVMDALERIEIAVRAVVSDTLSIKHNPHWFMDKNLFQAEFRHDEFLGIVKREVGYEKVATAQQPFIRHYYETYGYPELPPSWMIFEVLSFGTVSQIYKFLHLPEQKEIASTFNLDDKVMRSWLRTISYLRNLCAHHSRLWNRRFTIKPLIANSYRTYLKENDRFYAQAVVVQILLKEIVGNSHWADRLASLIEKHPSLPSKNMGFPTDWRDQVLWKKSE